MPTSEKKTDLSNIPAHKQKAVLTAIFHDFFEHDDPATHAGHLRHSLLEVLACLDEVKDPAVVVHIRALSQHLNEFGYFCENAA